MREGGPRAREQRTLSPTQAAPISPLFNPPLPLSPHPALARWEVEGRAGFGISPRPPRSTPALCALQLGGVLGGSWWLGPVCQASLLCVPYSLPSPEALPQQDSRARGFTPQVQTRHKVHSGPRRWGKSPLHPVLYGWFLEGDPILFPLPLRLAGSSATRRVLAWTEAGPVCSEADELQARCGAAAGAELRRAAVMRYHHLLV
ncbi:hypothetical protein NQZ68_037981 [Dissostichus eleginoides]|nr:hypothetical protein NQZ68_037981 [Dissostichus eleginoides]